MPKLAAIITGLTSSVLATTLCGSIASAQTYNTDYVSFIGELIVLDNPTSSGCQAASVNFNSRYTVSYRYSANPSVISDALALFPHGDSAAKFKSTQSSGSLNGSSTGEWSYINHYGNSDSTPLTSSSNLTISSGLGQPVGLGTGNIKILGSMNAFLSNSGCNVANVHAALVVIPQ